MEVSFTHIILGIVGFIFSYVMVRLLSSAIFRSYFEAKAQFEQSKCGGGEKDEFQRKVS